MYSIIFFKMGFLLDLVSLLYLEKDWFFHLFLGRVEGDRSQILEFLLYFVVENIILV